MDLSKPDGSGGVDGPIRRYWMPIKTHQIDDRIAEIESFFGVKANGKIIEGRKVYNPNLKHTFPPPEEWTVEMNRQAFSIAVNLLKELGFYEGDTHEFHR